MERRWRRIFKWISHPGRMLTTWIPRRATSFPGRRRNRTRCNLMSQTYPFATFTLTILIPALLLGGDAAPRKLKGHQGSVLGVAFSPDGKILASCSRDKTIKLWDPATGELQRTLTEHTADVYDVTFSPKGNLLASAGRDKTIKLWQMPAAKLIRTLEGHTDIVRSVAFAPDQKTLASGSVD